MKKLGDLYFNYDAKSGEYNVASHANMDEKNKQLVEDLMRDAKVQYSLNNACKNINNITRKEQNILVTSFNVNLNSSISSASMIKIEVTLLKLEDESDLMVSLFTMVNII
ncbi:MAG: hypothetical protein M0Q13_02505 [Methanothrix sp.]|jgi:hypothetical protein|nr:hypothetical protein [Methanothrix sp.]